MAIYDDSIITYPWYLWLQSTNFMKMCFVLCLSVRVWLCYLPIIAEYYLQMLFFLLFSDLYSNQIKLYSHNYTTLPKALKRMWVFYFCVIAFIVWLLLQSWTKMLRKMHILCLILEHFPLKPGLLKILPPPPPPKKQSWSVAGTFLLLTKQHWPVRGGGRGHHSAKFTGWVSCE